MRVRCLTRRPDCALAACENCRSGNPVTADRIAKDLRPGPARNPDPGEAVSVEDAASITGANEVGIDRIRVIPVHGRDRGKRFSSGCSDHDRNQ